MKMNLTQTVKNAAIGTGLALASILPTSAYATTTQEPTPQIQFEEVLSWAQAFDVVEKEDKRSISPHFYKDAKETYVQQLQEEIKGNLDNRNLMSKNDILTMQSILNTYMGAIEKNAKHGESFNESFHKTIDKFYEKEAICGLLNGAICDGAGGFDIELDSDFIWEFKKGQYTKNGYFTAEMNESDSKQLVSQTFQMAHKTINDYVSAKRGN